MISALRKIENRGELPGATSAVMEMCLDNPREGFADLFATHPSVDSRVQALVKFAGGQILGRWRCPRMPPRPMDRLAAHPRDRFRLLLPSGPWSDGAGSGRLAYAGTMGPVTPGRGARRS